MGATKGIVFWCRSCWYLLKLPYHCNTSFLHGIFYTTNGFFPNCMDLSLLGSAEVLSRFWYAGNFLFMVRTDEGDLSFLWKQVQFYNHYRILTDCCLLWTKLSPYPNEKEEKEDSYSNCFMYCNSRNPTSVRLQAVRSVTRIPAPWGNM